MTAVCLCCASEELVNMALGMACTVEYGILSLKRKPKSVQLLYEGSKLSSPAESYMCP